MTTIQTKSEPPATRGRLTAFVKDHEFIWDLVMGALTVVYVALAFSDESAIGLGDYAIWGLSALFLIEFSARCWDSPDRSDYLRGHWLDLITSIPVPGVPGLRIIRLLRLLRFARVGALIRRLLLDRGWNEGGLIWPTLFLFWIGSALALWLVEHDAPGSSINSFPDAMTAAFLTAATLGFGRHVLPVTQDGQIIAALIVFFALGLWGFASGNLTRKWLRSREEDATVTLDTLRRELDAIRDQLSQLTDAVIEGNSARKPREPNGTPTLAESDLTSV